MLCQHSPSPKTNIHLSILPSILPSIHPSRNPSFIHPSIHHPSLSHSFINIYTHQFTHKATGSVPSLLTSHRSGLHPLGSARCRSSHIASIGHHSPFTEAFVLIPTMSTPPVAPSPSTTTAQFTCHMSPSEYAGRSLEGRAPEMADGHFRSLIHAPIWRPLWGIFTLTKGGMDAQWATGKCQHLLRAVSLCKKVSSCIPVF